MSVCPRLPPRVHPPFVPGLAGLLVAVAGTFLGTAPDAFAEEAYPAKFVKIITTTGTGTGPDVVIRIVAEQLSRDWGRQVVVENNSTGGGLVASRMAASAPHDGHTLLAASASSFTVLPIRQPKAPTRIGTDLKPIAYYGDMPLTVAVSPKLGVASIGELVALSKKDPDKVLYAANASGTLPHMAGELLRIRSQAQYRFVPYRGAAEGLKDVLSGQINMIIDGYAALEGTLKSGHIKALAVTSSKRLANFNDVPTVAETIPGYLAVGWAALTAPVGVPDAIVEKINRDMRTAMTRPSVVNRLEGLGAYVVPMTTKELAAFIKREQDQWHPVIRQILAKAPAKK